MAFGHARIGSGMAWLTPIAFSKMAEPPADNRYGEDLGGLPAKQPTRG
jgi:hypothetical protein